MLIDSFPVFVNRTALARVAADSVLLASVIVAATVLATAAEAQNYPWCAIYKGGAMNCGFTSYQQCLATVSQAGLCIQNSTYQPPEGPRPRYRRGYPY
jgi:hypothetical protein